MAKLRHNSPTGNEQIDESDFVQCNQQGQSRTAGLEHSRVRCSPRKKAAKSYRDLDESSGEEPDRGVKLLPKTIPKSTSQGKQIRLAPLNALSASRSLTQGIGPGIPSFGSQGLAKRSLPEQARPTPRRKAAERPKVFGAAGSSDDSFEIEIEESFWCGSHTSSDDSEEALLSPRKFLAFPRSCKDESKTLPTNSETNLSFRLDNLTLSGQRDLPNASQTTAGLSIPLSRPSSSSYKENHTAFVRFSPPRLHSPSKTRQDRPVTPPQSPSKPRLQSPSKTKSRVPTPPLRQSLDGFWNVDTVNDWNDQYSPKKVLKSPKKLQFIRDDASTSPTSSIQKCQSPYKRNRAELAAKKKFESMKHEVAEDFLAELDAVITSGKIKQLAGTTGGVRFLWSKTLNSTAGRANWRKETTKTRQSDGTTETTYRHHASIELAEKVIDDENRLLNVIAHEFCHLANFMVSGIKDQPHGRQFKEWGRVCTKAFGDRGVEVTTKHSYQIEYKYIWQCSNEDCAAEFKRHSKSIDPKRHTCGSCRSKLIQVKPVPRKDAGNGTATGYAAYVKLHFAAVKRGVPGVSQKEVMEAIGRKYRADKADKSSSPEDKAEDGVETGIETLAEVDKVARVLEFVTLDDE